MMRRFSGGLSAIYAVIRKELYSYLVSPIAYVAAAVFLVVNGFIFYGFLDTPQGEADLRPILPATEFILMLVVPVLTMRLLAEERSSGTAELLMTFPITDTQVVIGKYIATLIVYVLMLVPTLAYVVVLRIFGDSEWGPLVSAYVGLILLGGTYIAVGMLTSSLTRSQIVAGLVGIGVLLMLWVMSAAPTFLQVLSYLSLQNHFDTFGQGVIQLKDVIFYLSFIVAALFFTIRIFESSRWRA